MHLIETVVKYLELPVLQECIFNNCCALKPLHHTVVCLAFLAPSHLQGEAAGDEEGVVRKMGEVAREVVPDASEDDVPGRINTIQY